MAEPPADFRGFRERPMHFEPAMSDSESLMWQVEKDPWLDPSGALVTILDGPADPEVLRRRIAYAVAVVPRLRERVVPGVGALAPPRWMPDPEFDLDYHVRHTALPGIGTRRQLFDLAALLYQDPFDRSRPLWRFWLVDNVEGGKSALISKLHHTIADGIGAIRLAEIYMDLSRKPEDTPEVDLAAILAADERVASANPSFPDRLQNAIGHQVRRQAGIARRTLAELSTWPADPRRVVDSTAHSIAMLRNAVNELFGDDDSDDDESDVSSGSPIWATRSRHRVLEGFILDLDAVKTAAKRRGGTVNDLFVAGIAEGAIAYHHDRGADLHRLHMTYVVSTRSDHAIGGNAWVPTKIGVDAAGDFEDRFASIVERSSARKADAGSRISLDGLASIAAALPTSVLTQFARQQAKGIDIATSNLRAAPFECFIAGAKIVENYPMGPLAGTACNVTTISYNGTLGVGLFIDPTAVDDPAELRRCVADAFEKVLEG